jgi:hypothetical protein
MKLKNYLLVDFEIQKDLGCDEKGQWQMFIHYLLINEMKLTNFPITYNHLRNVYGILRGTLNLSLTH